MSDDENIIACSRCGQPTSFERHDTTMPEEGEKCEGGCDRWVCTDCVDWRVSGDKIVCKDCAAGS